MKTIELTEQKDVRILINFQNVSHVKADDKDGGSIIFLTGRKDYNVISVKENIDDIISRLKTD